MKILVIHTGGTIGSTVHNGIISADGNSPFIKKIIEKQGDYSFDEDNLCSVLSENADDAFYEKLINHILKRDLSEYDGIIVLHGTDTLSYTSSLTAMALRHISVPICFVSANYVPDDERSNAFENFKMALGYITLGGKGFVVPYRNANGRRLFHLATRLNEADFMTGSFDSFGGTPFAEIVNNYFVSYEDKTGISEHELGQSLDRIIKEKLKLDKKIMLINGFPSIDFSCYCPEKEKIAAVLYSAYHSGTVTTKGLPRFIEKCKNNGIDFYISPMKKGRYIYESTKDILSSGASFFYNVSKESALARLKLAYNLPGVGVGQNLYFEELNDTEEKDEKDN